MKTISFMNIKGGCAKTQSALNLAYGLAFDGYKILLIDFDPQSSATESIIFEKPTKSIVDLLDEQAEISDVIMHPQNYENGNIDLIPSALELYGMKNKIQNDISRTPQTRLKKIIVKIRELNLYDFVIIDCGPDISILNSNVIVATDMCIVPVNPDVDAIKGLKYILMSYNELSIDYVIPNKPVVLLTMVNRNQEQASLVKDLKNQPGLNVFNSTIRFQAKPVTSCKLNHQILCRDKLYSGVGQDYRCFIDEIENKCGYISEHTFNKKEEGIG